MLLLGAKVSLYVGCMFGTKNPKPGLRAWRILTPAKSRLFQCFSFSKLSMVLGNIFYFVSTVAQCTLVSLE